MRTLLALIVTIAFSVPSFAQEACTSIEVNTAVISMMADLSSLQIAGLNQDIPATLSAMTTLRATLDQLESACAPHSESPSQSEQSLVFSGTGSRVTDAFELPRGTYRVTGHFIRSNQLSRASVTLLRLSGRCALAMTDTTYLFGSNGDDQEALVQSQGCEALLEIDGDMREWTVTFDLIR